MKQGIKKAMSLLLAMAFVLQTASVISLFQEDGRAFAAEMGGTSADVLDSLRIESNAVDIGADGDNPYSENKNKVINMFPRMELMMYNNVAGELKIYDYDQPVKESCRKSGNIRRCAKHIQKTPCAFYRGRIGKHVITA